MGFKIHFKNRVATCHFKFKMTEVLIDEDKLKKIAEQYEPAIFFKKENK